MNITARLETSTTIFRAEGADAIAAMIAAFEATGIEPLVHRNMPDVVFYAVWAGDDLEVREVLKARDVVVPSESHRIHVR